MMKTISGIMITAGLILMIGSIGNYDFYEETNTIVSHCKEVEITLYCILGMAVSVFGLFLNELLKLN